MGLFPCDHAAQLLHAFDELHVVFLGAQQRVALELFGLLDDDIRLQAFAVPVAAQRRISAHRRQVQAGTILRNGIGALSDRLAGGKIIVVDQITFEEPKTKNFVKVLENLKAAEKALVVLGADDASVVRASGNVPSVKTSTANTINVYDLMNAQTVILTKDAVAKIEEVYA